MQGVPPAAREEFDAHAKEGDRKLKLVYSIPTSMAIILDIDLELDGKSGSRVKSPTPALLKALAEKKAMPPVQVPRPATAYAGPAPTPMRGPTPPGPTRPVVPPPSEIVLDDEDEVPAVATP